MARVAATSAGWSAPARAGSAQGPRRRPNTRPQQPLDDEQGTVNSTARITALVTEDSTVWIAQRIST